MRKFLFFLPVLAALILASCSESTDDVAKNFNVKVELKAMDGIDLSKVTDLEVTIVNLTTSKEQTATPVEGVVSFSLPVGNYDCRATGKLSESAVSGILSNVAIQKDETLTLEVGYAAANSTLIFKEVYFSGVKSYYFKDAFYEIYNNSDEVQYLDGLILGIVDEGLVNAKPAPSTWLDENGNLPDRYPMASFTMYFPGTGKEHALQPGESTVVATNPINHSERPLGANDVKSPVDLSNADWDIYCYPYSKVDTDIAGVPNMEYAYHTFGIDFMPATDGQALIIARLPEGQKVVDFVADKNNFQKAKNSSFTHLMIPSDYVLDGIEIVRAPENIRFKHLLPKTDMGMTWVDGSNDGSAAAGAYSGKSLRRKVASIKNGIVKFKDTNNSSVDFILGGGVPTPGVMPTAVDK